MCVQYWSCNSVKTTNNLWLCNFNTIALPTKRFNYYFRFGEVLRNSIYLLCFNLSIFRLPLHGPLLHGLVSFSHPEQCVPPLDGGGLVQVRERSCFPAPQVTLHSLQSPKSLHPPSTAHQQMITTEIKSKRGNAFNLICCSQELMEYSVENISAGARPRFALTNGQ